eukprot:6425147-Alexandrium_andersonii.AAC.1
MNDAPLNDMSPRYTTRPHSHHGSTAPRHTAQHSTAQHSTSQHSTVHYSTVRHIACPYII